MATRSRALVLSRLRSILLLGTGAAFLFACVAETATPKKRKRTPYDPGDEFFGEEVSQEEQPIEPDLVNQDSGAFGAGSRPAKDGGGSRTDAAPEDGGVLPKVFCTGGLAAGDLAIVELMISSRAGSGDGGEWIEIQSTRSDCWLRLQGVTIESPRGQAAPNAVTITEDFELPPNGTFVVAASADPAKNNGLPGKVFAWGATDVLKNDGDTIVVKLGPIALDQLTYPAFSNLEAGRALSFPDDCAWNARGDWARWSLTFDEWTPGFKGTPNGPNADVACF